jgi:DNA-binding transcriptional LysR family regulator
LSAAAFLQRYREVTVEVDLSDRPVDLLGEGYDLALRIGMLEDSTLIARRIASIERVYCASPAYLAERGTPLKPEDLHNHDCLPYGHGRQVQWRSTRAGQAAAGQRHRAHAGQQRRVAQGRSDCGDGHYLPADLHRRFGIEGRATGAGAGRVQPEPLTLSAVYPQHRQASRPVQALIEFLRERLDQM